MLWGTTLKMLINKMDKTKVAFILFVVAYLSACSPSTTNSDPFELQFEPIANMTGSKQDYLSKVIVVLEESEYSVTPNDVFATVTTLPKNLGTQRWRVNGEKWHLEYQLSVHIIEGNSGQFFWKLNHKIIGIRSGRQPRAFYPEDFEITEEIFNAIHRKLVLALR